MVKRLIGWTGLAAVVAAVVYINVAYWSDPPYWRRWVGLVTTTDPTVVDFKPLEAVVGPDAPLAVADRNTRSVSNLALERAVDYAKAYDSFALIVVHRERVQIEWYADYWQAERLTQSQSMHKTLVALAAGIAIDEGAIAGVDVPIGTYITEWADDPRGRITLRQLLVMSSGLRRYGFTFNPFAGESSFRFLNTGDRIGVLLATPLEWTPGTRYEYNDVNAALVGLVVERATGRRYADYLQEKIWQPMGGASAAVWLDRDDGFAMTACCMLAPAMDWARIGILVKNRGRFGETQIVPADWVDAMTAPNELNPAFGYFTWLAENETLEKSQVVDRDASEEAFLDPNLIMLRGYGGQRVYISRAYDLVIVRLGPFSGYQPLKPGWQDTYLFNGLVRGLRSAE